MLSLPNIPRQSNRTNCFTLVVLFFVVQLIVMEQVRGNQKLTHVIPNGSFFGKRSHRAERAGITKKKFCDFHYGHHH
jgi:hypothetical protein